MGTSTKMTVEDLKRLQGLLELGMHENRLVQTLVDTLDSEPEALLPHAIGLVSYVSFLLTKVDRDAFAQRVLLACLAWAIESEQEEEQGPTLIENISYILRKNGLNLDAEEIRRRAIERDYGDTDSWVFVTKPRPPAASQEDMRGLDVGIRAGVSSRLPLTTFEGWLKRLDPGVLNEAGRALMKEVFSRFGSLPSIEQYIQKTERLIDIGVRFSQNVLDDLVTLRRQLDAGMRVEPRRHRRYAGGDGRLPRSCYSSVCSDAQGSDGGSLNRELMEYVHPAFPGLVFVGDSSDPRCTELLARRGIGVRPGYCALCVFIFAPEDGERRRVFNEVYSQTLEQSGGPDLQARFMIVESYVDYVEIDNVIDLRLPETQEWFFRHFKSGDGVHLSKPNGEQITDFCDMLPTLMHPELGGCDATHGIGSWMRTNDRVNALIYPSARSDAQTSLLDGRLVGFSGWNMVDYRGADDIASTEVVVDHEPWDDFHQLAKVFNRPEAVLHRARPGSPDEGSWIVRGVQTRYDHLYTRILG